MKLSIIIPTKDRLEKLELCLAALFYQIKAGDEIIVVDDASDDGSLPYLEKLKKENSSLRVHALKENHGQGFARNFGASLANNEIVVFIDSDIEVGLDHLEKMRSYFQANPFVSAVTGRLALSHPYKNFFSRYKNAYMNFIFGLMPKEVNFLYGSICAVRSEDLMDWPEDFLYGEDTELGQRMTEEGKQIHFLSEVEVIHHKSYSLKSLIKNDFMIPMGFARSFLFYSGWKKVFSFHALLGDQSFSHVKNTQIISLFLSLCFILSLLSGSLMALAPIGLGYLALNGGFFSFLYREEGFLFAVRASFWTLFDQVIMFFGAVSGICYHSLLWILSSLKQLGENLD